MDQATIDCLTAALSEILGTAGITAIIAYLRSFGAEAIEDKRFRRLLKRVLKGFLKKGLTRFIPWLGIIALLVEIYIMLRDCL